MKFHRYFIITLLFSFFPLLVLAEESKCPEINSIDNARDVFLKDYQQQNYRMAIQNLSLFVDNYQESTKCWLDNHGTRTCRLCEINKKAKQKLLWSYSDMALAAYKLGDAKLCLSNYVKSSDLGYNPFSKKKSKASQALEHNYFKCIGLPNVEDEIIGSECEEKYGEDCFHIKQIVAAKMAHRYPKAKSKDPRYPKGLDLKPFGMQGTVILKKGSHLGDDGERQCPKIYWAKGKKIKELKLKKSEKYDFEAELEMAESCCNIGADNLALTKQNNSIKLQISYYGTDCFGGSARWFSEEFFGVNFTDYSLKFEMRKTIGFH